MKKPRVVSATKLNEILSILDDILTEMHLPAHTTSRIQDRIKKVKEG